jgi:tricorn protease
MSPSRGPTKLPSAPLFAALVLPVLAPLAALCAAEQPLTAGFYRYPSVGGGVLVFAAEGDLWKVPAAGGVAQRLTAHEGEERFPRVSPDGAWIAFTAQYEGNDDVYLMPAAGGEPKRLTRHPHSDQALGWTPAGEVLFRSRRDHPHRDYRAFTVPREGGTAKMIPLEPAAWVAFEPGGDRIALQKIGLEFHNWKRYKGGEAEEIWIGRLAPLAFEEVARWEGKDAFPMWGPDGRIYFVTDRWGRPNLASMAPDGSDVRQLSRFADYDVRWPAMGDGRIVFQHAMDLWSFDLATGAIARIEITLPSDRLQVRERFVDPAGTLHSWSLSRDGERIALEARGDLFVARTRKKGLIRRITESSAARTQFPAFSPDGKSLAAWTEIEGEQQLLLHAADAAAAPKQLGALPPGWHFPPAWSPDGRRIAWGDESYRLRVMEVATGAVVEIDRGEYEISRYAWSPDSRYLAYDRLLDTLFRQVRVWDGETRRVHPASDPLYDSFSPAWDPEGARLYYLSDRHINPFLDRSEARFIVDQATLPVVVALRADVRLPFAPRGDVDPPEETDARKDGKETKKGGGADTGKADEVEKPVAPIRIDFDGLAERLVLVPTSPGNLSALAAVAGKLHWLHRENAGMMPPGEEDEDEPRAAELQTYEIEKEKLSTLASGVLGYEVSGDGKVLVYRSKEGFTRVEAGATKAPKDEEAKEAKIDLSGWSMRIDPRAEWRQMLHEAWRLQRDFFYDPAMHGVDWRGVWEQYGPLAARIASRDDLADLLGEMFGELSVGHAYHGGGDLRRGKRVGVGLLAADLEPDPATGFCKILKIHRGDHPDPEWSSPLARADLRIEPGQWLVAIDGRPLVPGEDYLERLADRAGKEVELSINAEPKLAGARRLVVRPVGDDSRIRYASWVRETRAYVEKRSGGRIGYLHLYDMGGLGLRQFARDYPPQWRKQALIVDDRWNHGGFVAPMILAHLDRKILAVGGTRHGAVDTTPSHAFHGHLLALINRQGGSDCETLALGFQRFGLGPVIGTRTWGGWVGIRGDKPLRDGGLVTQPEFGGWDPQGREWVIEGHGVDPDLVLDLPPDGLLHGDAQIDYAIERLLGEIEKNPPTLAAPPPIRPRPLVVGP